MTPSVVGALYKN